MSLTMHLVVFGLVIVDLLVGGWAAGRLGGSYATTAFEFITILGYIIFVLQWGVPWGQVKKLTSSDAQASGWVGFDVAVSEDTAVVGAAFIGTDADLPYVFQRDQGGAGNWGEISRLTASDAEAGDSFGESVAVSGDTAVVGATGEGAGGSNAGAAYIFQRSQGGAGNWGQVSKLTASDAQAGDAFGRSVAVSGDTAIVGAFAEDAGGSGTGAAYVFQRDEGGTDNWGELKKLTASDAEAEDYFGYSVAVSGDTAVVSADWEDAGGTDAGAAYVFQRDEGGTDNWGEVKKLTASDAEAEDHFGFSVSVSGDAAVVGAILEDSLGPNGGAAYVFQRDQGGAGNWGEVKKLTASDAQTEDEFGVSVAVSGDTALVATNLEDAGGFRAGAAYVFQRDQGSQDNWGEVKKLVASDAQTGADFGGSVSVSGNTAVIGAFSEDTGGDRTGAAYVFQRDQGGVGDWGEVKKLTASDAQTGDYFGGSVAVSRDTAVVGARFEDAAGSDAGAAYVFDLLQPKPAGDANCDGTADDIDAALVLQFTAGLLRSLDCQDAADVNSATAKSPAWTRH